MERYVMSGSLTQQMHDYLASMPDFIPLDILITQLDRSAITKAIQWKHEGFCRWLFIDSGAFSIHTGNAKLPGWKGTEQPTFRDWEDAYIDYINSIDEDIDVCAQLDTIPGKFGQPKSAEDYVESAKKSWDNFLYMRTKVKSPHKVMPVFHYGESMQVLKDMLEWKDENGEPLDYVGLSPANDASVAMKDIYLKECADLIHASSNPNVKTHLYGYTSLEGLSKLPCYSADSISHRHIAAYCKILSPTFGVVSVTDRDRTTKNKSSMSFFSLADEHNVKILEQEVAECNLTMDQIRNDSSARVAFNIHSIQKLISTKYAYDPNKLRRTKRLF